MLIVGYKIKNYDITEWTYMNKYVSYHKDLLIVLLVVLSNSIKLLFSNFQKKTQKILVVNRFNPIAEIRIVC